MNFREFLNLFRAGREGQGKEIVAAKIFRRPSEGAAEGGLGVGGVPPRPSERIRDFSQNGFALFLEYPTIQNFSTFSLGTSPNARRAERRGSQGIEPKNPTARKKKRKRTVYLKS